LAYTYFILFRIVFYVSASLPECNTVTLQYRKTHCNYTGWPQKTKPLPNDHKIVLNRIKTY